MTHHHRSQSAVRIFFNFDSERDQEVHENYINGFSPKNISSGLPKMTRLFNSGSALTIFIKFCTMKVANKYVKIMLIVFLQKILKIQKIIFQTCLN